MVRRRREDGATDHRRRLRQLALVVVLGVLAAAPLGCQPGAVGDGPAGGGGPGGGPDGGGPGGGQGDGGPGGGGSVDGIELVRQSFVDPQINGIEAFSLLIPSGWRYAGGVEWRHDMANLAAAVVVIEDPAGGAALETYYPVPHAYTEPSLIPIGGNWLGSIVQPPLAAADYLTQLVIPGVRPSATIGGVESLPQVATTVAAAEVALPGATVQADAVRIRTTSDRGGRAFEEDFYATVAYQTVGGIVTWGARHLYSLRAPAGELDAATPLLQSIASSVEVSPLWSANYQIVFDLFVQGQYAGIRAAGELSRYLARNADEIADIYRSAYENQQAAYDRVFEGFSEYVRGVERYDVPNVGRTNLPNENTVCHFPGTASVLLIGINEICPRNTNLLQPVR